MALGVVFMERELDKRCYEMCDQMFQIGYLDGRNGVERTKEELDQMLDTICLKYSWSRSSDEYNWIGFHYYKGLNYYNEVEYLYYNKLSTQNPKHSICYPYLLEKDNLDPDIRNIITSYLDFDYEMKIYDQEKEANRQK